MRKFAILIFFFVCTSAAFAQETDSKTFLVFFKSKELKNIKTSIKEIQSQFSTFETKIYSGNSDLALLIDIPSCDFDECFLGQFLIETKNGQQLKLQDIAFRLFDMTKNQESLQVYLTSYEESLHKRKNSKSDKASQ